MRARAMNGAWWKCQPTQFIEGARFTMSESASIKKVSAWHEELMDFMMAQPRAGLREAADYFDVSMSWLSTVKNSDAFQEAWAVRRGLHSSAIDQGIRERVEGLAEVTIETMTRKIEKEGESMGLSTLREVSETALKSLGFGQKNANANTLPQGQGNTTIHGNVVMIDRNVLAEARATREKLQRQNAVEFKDHQSAPEQLESRPALGSGAEAIHTDLPPREFVDKDGMIIEHDTLPPRRGPTAEMQAAVAQRAGAASQQLVDDFLNHNYQLEAGDEDISE